MPPVTRSVQHASHFAAMHMDRPLLVTVKPTFITRSIHCNVKPTLGPHHDMSVPSCMSSHAGRYSCHTADKLLQLKALSLKTIHNRYYQRMSCLTGSGWYY